MSFTVAQGYTKTDRRGALAVALGSAVWGLFWLPLRSLDEHGVNGLWAIALIMGAAALPALILVWQQRESVEFRSATPWLVGFALGTSSVLYFIGLLYSDVVRVIFLFYLLPVWTTFAARIIYGEPIKRQKFFVIAVALSGLWFLLGGGSELPLPKNIGDWCGIGSGLFWGVSLALLRNRETSGAFASTAAALCAACLVTAGLAIAFNLVAIVGQGGMLPDSMTLAYLTPEPRVVLTAIPLALLFGCIVMLPSMLGQIWGARRIPAPTAALLTMTEIIVATLSAYFLIGTELGTLAFIGGALIVLAVVIDLKLN